MIYGIPYPMPDGNGWCGNCPFLDTQKEGSVLAYCPFLKKELAYYDWYISECDIDYDCQWAKENHVNNEYSE